MSTNKGRPMTRAEARRLTDEAKAMMPSHPNRRGRLPRSVPTDVYRLYNETGALLYVGLSLSTAQRMGQHRQTGWWRNVTRIEIERYPSRDDASARERELIALLQPPYNRNGGS